MSRTMNVEKKIDPSLKAEILTAQAIAEELGYKKKYIDRFIHAKSEIQLHNMLKDARENS